MEKKTPKEKAREMYDYFCDQDQNSLLHFEILKHCVYIANEKINEAYKIDIRYYKEYINFWHDVLNEFNEALNN